MEQWFLGNCDLSLLPFLGRPQSLPEGSQAHDLDLAPH